MWMALKSGVWWDCRGAAPRWNQSAHPTLSSSLCRETSLQEMMWGGAGGGEGRRRRMGRSPCLGPCCFPLSTKAPAHMPALPPTCLSFLSRVKGEKRVNPVTPLLWQPHHLPHVKDLLMGLLLLNIPSQQVSNALKILLDEGNVAKTFRHCTWKRRHRERT